MSGPAERPEQACASWQAWLVAVVPGEPLPPMPAVVVPAGLETRRREVLDRLAAATRAAERRRDELAAELARLAPPVTRPAASYTDGATLDVVG